MELLLSTHPLRFLPQLLSRPYCRVTREAVHCYPMSPPSPITQSTRLIDKFPQSHSLLPYSGELEPRVGKWQPGLGTAETGYGQALGVRQAESAFGSLFPGWVLLSTSEPAFSVP